LVEELPELGNFGLKLGLKLRELGEANLHDLPLLHDGLALSDLDLDRSRLTHSC